MDLMDVMESELTVSNLISNVAVLGSNQTTLHSNEGLVIRGRQSKVNQRGLDLSLIHTTHRSQINKNVVGAGTLDSLTIVLHVMLDTTELLLSYYAENVQIFPNLACNEDLRARDCLLPCIYFGHQTSFDCFQSFSSTI